MTSLSIDPDLVRWSAGGEPLTADAAVQELATRPLLLLLHGYGSFEGDLIELAPRLPERFVCASPRAPLVAPPPVVGGYAWFPIPFASDGTIEPQPDPEHFAGTDPHTAAVALLEWFDSLDRRVSGGIGEVALLGFSQGGAMVTSLLRLRPERFACGVNCSGFVAPGAFEGDVELRRFRPPLFWGRDEADPIVRGQRIVAMSEWAPAHTTLDARLYPGIEHSIGLDELADISQFLELHTRPRAGA